MLDSIPISCGLLGNETAVGRLASCGRRLLALLALPWHMQELETAIGILSYPNARAKLIPRANFAFYAKARLIRATSQHFYSHVLSY
jgi:hypothetical protein